MHPFFQTILGFFFKLVGREAKDAIERRERKKKAKKYRQQQLLEAKKRREEKRRAAIADAWKKWEEDRARIEKEFQERLKESAELRAKYLKENPISEVKPIDDNPYPDGGN
jgi:hypothetical protein